MFFKLKITYILKSRAWGMEERVAMGTKCLIAVDVFPVELKVPSFNGLRCKLAKIALFIYLM